MADTDPALVTELERLLEAEREQQRRLRDALTTTLRMIEQRAERR